MLDAHDIIDAAVMVRTRLDELVGGEEARRLRTKLDELLSSPLAEDDLAGRLRDLLLKHAGTRLWLLEREEASDGGDEPVAEELLGPRRRPVRGQGADGGGRTAYARIDCPAEVVVGEPFDVVVGLRTDADPAVFGSEMGLPPASTVIWVHVTADGMDVASGRSWRHKLLVEADGALPYATLRLIPQPQEGPVREARVQALFTVDGQAIGFGSRAVSVAADRSLLGGRLPEQPGPGVTAPFPVQQQPPDLTVWLRTGTTPGALMWTFETPASVPVPDEAIETTIGQRADEYARHLIRDVNLREGKPDLFPLLRGVGKEIAEKMPAEFFGLLRAVAKRVQHPPLVQLLTEEPYVPWELAWLDEPLDPGLPEFLAAQATVGRWTTGTAKPPVPPPDTATGHAIAVVSGVYDKVPGWKRLEAAEQEAAELGQLYGATPVDALLDSVLAALDGQPPADVLHFAVHGNYDPQGGMDGLVLVDKQVLHPKVVGGYTLQGAPFIFLNACQVGTGREVLGDYAGLAAAFLRAGACAVVAPLWSVKDTVAKKLALRFYENVRAGGRPAEVLRVERAAAEASESPPSATTLAYQFFGHPAMTMRATDREDP